MAQSSARRTDLPAQVGRQHCQHMVTPTHGDTHSCLGHTKASPGSSGPAKEWEWREKPTGKGAQLSLWLCRPHPAPSHTTDNAGKDPDELQVRDEGK